MASRFVGDGVLDVPREGSFSKGAAVSRASQRSVDATGMKFPAGGKIFFC
ncbi:MAG: hypothetical protein GXZ02_10445 [Clostridiales bacterium]|nr:hypothetical protein [Clostridiales bacterium]